MSNLKKLLEEKEYELENAEGKIKSRGDLIVALISLILILILILPNLSKNVNEAEFCLNKLKIYFPEYDWYKANYCATKGLGVCIEGFKGTCKGEYRFINGTIEIRDGLEEMKESQTKVARFKLINQKEITYLESDNWNNVGLFFGMVFFAISFIIFLCRLICGGKNG